LEISLRIPYTVILSIKQKNLYDEEYDLLYVKQRDGEHFSPLFLAHNETNKQAEEAGGVIIK